MSLFIMRACESFYYRFPGFPVIEPALTPVRMAPMRNGEQTAAFDGFVRPSLLNGVVLPQFVTPEVSFDIEVRIQGKEETRP